MPVAWRLRRLAPLTVALAIAPLALAACSSEREESPGAGSTAQRDCQQSTGAQERYDAAWREGQEALGLSGLQPDDVEVCDVDTSRFRKEGGGQVRVAFAAQGPTNSWALTNEEALRYRAEQRDADVLYASANGDAARQVDNIQQLASQDPDAMVVVPMGPGITGQVRAAAQQGVPVVLCAGRLEQGSGAVSTVTRSYELQATLWAEWLAQQLDEKGRIAMLSGIAGVPTAEFQRAAAEKVFARYPDIEVVAKEYTDWSPTKAKTVARSLVGRDLDGIWSDSAISDLGVVEAYEDAGREVPPLTGDSSNAFLKAVDDKDVRFALSAFPPEMSMQCLDVALDAAAGKPVPSVVNVESAVFTDEQLDEFVRPDCSDNLWVPSKLPAQLLRRLELC